VLTLVGGAAVLLACLLVRASALVKFYERSLRRVERRESDVLEAVRILTAASRESSAAVLIALDRTLRVLDPAIDDVLVFVPETEELACIFAGGGRSEHFRGVRLRRDASDSLPARAALCAHRAQSGDDARKLMPTDRATLAIPMLDGRGLAAVVYVASARAEAFGEPDALVRAVGQTASPFALAAEREADRASATYDGLTGLLTPRAFRSRLQDDVAHVRLLPATTLSLWFIDTDDFKAVNDRFGHGAGDVVLQRMAALLRDHAVPGVDVVARNGGDEFCAIIRDAQKTVAIARAQAFCEAVRAASFGVEARITASVGLASYPQDATSAQALLELADAAMYHSKHAGRDRVAFALGGSRFAVYGKK
jgi:diguanylate cyclase (GGDEF)-like protein